MDFIRDELEQRGTEDRRTPLPGDPIYVFGERRTILSVTPDTVVVDDEAGFRQSRRRDAIWWDGGAFRSWHAVNASRRRHTFYATCANGHSRYVVRGGRRVCLDCRRDASARNRRIGR